MHILGYILLSKIIFQLTRVSVHACVRTILTVHTASVPTAIYTVWIQRWPGGTPITLQPFELVSCIVPYWKPLTFYYVIKVRGFSGILRSSPKIHEGMRRGRHRVWDFCLGENPSLWEWAQPRARGFTELIFPFWKTTRSKPLSKRLCLQWRSLKDDKKL